MEGEKCMPTPPNRVGREFVRHYYTIMNKSPENLHRFYTPDASFTHDDVNPAERRTIQAEGRKEIRNAMLERLPHFKHTSTRIQSVDTIETLDNGLLVQINGEISYNEQPMRSFGQTFILMPQSPFQYFVQNDMFRFSDFTLNDSNSDDVDTVAVATADQQDWGTQCEEYVEPYDEPIQVTAPRETNHNDKENEVKLDNSDSGLSSDAEKVIMDIQSNNLKSILQEPRSVTKETIAKRTPTPPTQIECEHEVNVDTEVEDISENQTKMFRDSCILTIGNVINPNIEFDDGNNVETTTSENEKTMKENVDVSKSEEYSSGRMKYRKRKERKALKVSFDESIEIVDVIKSAAENEATTVKSNGKTDETPDEASKKEDTEQTVTSESVSPLKSTSTPKKMQPSEQETSTTTTTTTTTTDMPEQKKHTYADLAKAGKDEWVDVPVRTSTERSKDRPPLVRRHSRNEKTSPPNDGNRLSPNSDLLQVFVGNIPHGAKEDDIRRMFSRFGRITRFRLHENTRKEWLPHYAFIAYDSIQSVQQCLKKKNSLYWPENSRNTHKLNVNGDPAIDSYDTGNRRKNEAPSQDRDLRLFGKNFVLAKESSSKRLSDSDSSISDSVKKNDRRRSRR